MSVFLASSLAHCLGFNFEDSSTATTEEFEQVASETVKSPLSKLLHAVILRGSYVMNGATGLEDRDYI